MDEQIHKLLQSNSRTTNDHSYTVPSPSSYPYQWLWDSCFHAVIWSHFDVQRAKDELRSLVSKQFESGLIPHVIYWEKSDILNIDWGKDDTSALTQPPLLAYAVLRIYEKDSDKSFLKEMYPFLKKYYEYLLTRDARSHHLFGIINPDESGEDNSPRFDLALNLSPYATQEENNKARFDLFEKNKQCGFDAVTCMRNFFWVKDVPFNCYLLENLDALGKIAHELGHENEHAYCEGQIALIQQAMRKRMLDSGLFWTICGPDHEKVKVRTWAIFAPLLSANFLSQDEASVLVEKHLRNSDEFWSTFPIPTVAKNEMSYSPEEPTYGEAWEHPNWRGPVWMAPNWFVYRGLKNYGFNEEARYLKEKSLLLVEHSGFREYYHPDTGEGMGAKDFTWGGLVIDMN